MVAPHTPIRSTYRERAVTSAAQYVWSYWGGAGLGWITDINTNGRLNIEIAGCAFLWNAGPDAVHVAPLVAGAQGGVPAAVPQDPENQVDDTDGIVPVGGLALIHLQGATELAIVCAAGKTADIKAWAVSVDGHPSPLVVGSAASRDAHDVNWTFLP